MNYEKNRLAIIILSLIFLHRKITLLRNRACLFVVIFCSLHGSGYQPSYRTKIYLQSYAFDKSGLEFSFPKSKQWTFGDKNSRLSSDLARTRSSEINFACEMRVAACFSPASCHRDYIAALLFARLFRTLCASDGPSTVCRSLLTYMPTSLTWK